MIINALRSYYDILKNDPKCEIATDGYSTAKISAAIVISKDGELVDIVPLLQADNKGKLNVPLLLNVPQQNSRSGKNPPPYFMCDNMKYVLGIDKDENPCEKQFEMFKEFHNEMLKDAQGDTAKTFLKFINSWDIYNALENEIILNNFEILQADRNLVFRIENTTNWLHQDKEICSVWEKTQSESTADIIGQCMVTGEKTAISRLHNPIKNVRNAQSAGASLVSFNAPAYLSYGKEQSFNAPVGKATQFAYTTVLNYMLSGKEQKIQIGDATTVFWAESADEQYKKIVMGLFAPMENAVEKETETENKRDKTTEKLVADVLKKAKDGIPIANISGTIPDNTKFYILGLSPNAARVSVRYFYADTFGGFVEKMSLHYKDMEMVKQFENEFTSIPVWKILQETAPPKSSDKKSNPLLDGSVMRSILSGGLYPDILYNSILQRIYRDSEIRVNYVRASILKLCLVRKARITNNKNLEGVLSVALNEDTKNIGYLLGRLFAMLEKVQMEASGNVNSSIKDKYFASACTTPRSVFPVLIRLSQHHISKATYGFITDKLIEKVMGDINEFPAHLSIEEQGLFAIGYYQQRVKLWEKKDKKSENIILEGEDNE